MGQDLDKDFAKDVVELDDLGYWPEGSCFCIFFGPTPISTKDKIKPASRVNILGKILGNPQEFKKIKKGEKIKIEGGVK